MSTAGDILKEYAEWKKHTPFLYDLIVTHALEWPSLTVQWLPDREEPEGEDFTVQKMILGTHTAQNAQNYLLLAQIQLPLGDAEDVDRDAFYSNFSSSDGAVRIIQEIKHDGEVNLARYMPQKPSIIATQTVSAEIFIFDCTKHPSEPPQGGVVCSPDLRLTGQEDEGYSLSWSPFKQGHLLSGSKDGQIYLWDVNATPKDNKTLDAMEIFNIHDGCLEDVAWHMKHEYLFGSVGEDKYLRIWDMRTPVIRPSHSVVAHTAEVNSLSFNPFNEWVVATGSHDKQIKLFDLRKISSALHTLKWPYQQEVAHVRWNPKNETILASSCLGRKLLVWDISRIGQKQTAQDAIDGPPELLFLHGGHTDRIADFSWNPCEEWVIASAADDNLLHIWAMSDLILNEEDHDLPADMDAASIASHFKLPTGDDASAASSSILPADIASMFSEASSSILPGDDASGASHSLAPTQMDPPPADEEAP